MNYILPLLVLAVIGATEAGLTVTGGSSLFLKAGDYVRLTGLTESHVCWASGTTSTTATCNSPGNALDAGASGCSAGSSSTTLNVTWTTTTNTHISFLECMDKGQGVYDNFGTAVVTVVTLVKDAGPVMFSPASGIITRATTITMSSADSKNICYTTTGIASLQTTRSSLL